MLVVSRPVQDWYRLHNHKCRSISENAEWFRRQLSGEYMAHIVQIFAMLSCRWSGRRHWGGGGGASPYSPLSVASVQSLAERC